MNASLRPVVLTGLVAVILLGMTGCGTTVVDPVKTGIAVKYDVEGATGVKVSRVNCPDGIAVRSGNRFACRVLAKDGRRALAEMIVLNDRADLRLIRLRRP